MPTLPGQTVVQADTEDLFHELGVALRQAAFEAVEARGVFHLALSGGSTPEPFYMRLVTDPLYRALPWATTHVWIVDERRVPESDAKSNMRMIRESLTGHITTPESQVHAVPTLAADPAGEYEAEMAAVFGMRPGAGVPRLDFVLLGMGGDAHTASLFPASPALLEQTRWFANNDGPRVVPPARITMTYPLLNHARSVNVLAVGGGKAQTLCNIARQMAQSGPDIQELPITGVNPGPAGGQLRWFLDHAAAAGLQG